MKGDFSTWRLEATDDHLGVLYQQGRLISDADLTEAEILALVWRITAGRDIIGANVAAVPAESPNGFRVDRALVDGDRVLVHLDPGRLWADGLHLTLHPDPANPGAPVVRSADYLPPPHNPAGTDTGDIDDGVRDAVILEVSLEALNGFQDPGRLIEAALGGPDTAERIIPRTALRLLRLEDGETCANIGDRLRDGLSAHGRLTVSLEPPTVIPGDCPVVEGGGYSGFEHNLYRIEIAETGGGPARFKWSQFNGGLVGRGRFHGGATPHVEITANRTAILTSGILDFYLEALEWDDEAGNWQLVYATTAALNADGELDLSAPPTFGTLPGSGDPVFFRLWNGLRNVSDFTDAVNPVELRDGIRLAFDPPASATYRPASWWNFDVRAGEIANEQVLIDDRPPEGPIIRRVPVAEIEWTDDEDTGLSGVIEDCRRRFRPLTNQKICCTYIVGNGLTTFGDFNSLEEAAGHLPPQGGRLCLLPGIHFANLDLLNARGIQIHGCRHRTFVFPRLRSFDRPVMRFEGGRDIQIADVDFIAPFGIAIDLEGTEETPLNEVVVSGCRIMALTFGIHVETVSDVTLLGNQIWLLDHPRGIATISVRATGGLIEKNRTGVWPFEYKPPGDDGGEEPDPADPCIEPDELFGNITAIVVYVSNAWITGLTSQPPTQPYRARGGIHLKGGSERVDLRRNRITGGLGHGITLGGVFPDETAPGTTPDDGGTPGLPNPTVRAVSGVFVGVVLDAAGAPQAGATVQLTQGSAPPLTGITDENGEIGMEAADGTYRIEIGPNLAIQTISRTYFGAFSLHTIIVAPVEEEDVTADEAFLTRIRILDNEIERMGLSGVGFWFHSIEPPEPPVLGGNTIDDLAEFFSAMLAPRELLRTTNIVRDLVIRGNRIENNLQVVFTDLLRAASRYAAQGGISLALVEGLRIEGNHITGNCPTAANPCAGIFVGYGEEILISGNYIAGNGPVTETYRDNRTDGLRGGIFIRLASSVLQGATRDGQQKPALVIRDNVIDQPAGRAITALAYGPVSCVGNTLNAEHEGAWGVFDTLVGAVLILNLGGIHRLASFAAAMGKTLTDIVDFDSVVGNVSAVSQRYQRKVEAMLPGGETLVNSNRVRSGPDNLAWCSQVIVTPDDLGFDANQSSMFRPDVTFANTIGVAHSLRLTDNRFRERALYTAMSALTVTGGTTVSGGARAMNMTTQNQGDHCIIATTFGTMPVEESPNQVVHSQFCPDIGSEEGVKRAYVFAALLLAWRFSVNPQFGEGEGEAVVEVTASKAVKEVAAFQMESQAAYAAEAYRAERLYGENAPRSWPSCAAVRKP